MRRLYKIARSSQAGGRFEVTHPLAGLLHTPRHLGMKLKRQVSISPGESLVLTLPPNVSLRPGIQTYHRANAKRQSDWRIDAQAGNVASFAEYKRRLGFVGIVLGALLTAWLSYWLS